MQHLQGYLHPEMREAAHASLAGRLPFGQLGGDPEPNNSGALRVQLLTGRHGVSEVRAPLLANLIWGGRHG